MIMAMLLTDSSGSSLMKRRRWAADTDMFVELCVCVCDPREEDAWTGWVFYEHQKLPL